MSPHGYEEIDHTADLALKVWGEDFTILLRQAARGLYALLGVTVNPDCLTAHEFVIKAGTEETVLVDFLNEVLYLAEDEQLYFDDFLIIEASHKVFVTGIGQMVTSIAREVKAVTFHDLAIGRTEEGLETTITFDV